MNVEARSARCWTADKPARVVFADVEGLARRRIPDVGEVEAVPAGELGGYSDSPGAERPIDDPLPDKPILDEPGRLVPVVDPRRPGEGRPIREPEAPREPGSG